MSNVAPFEFRYTTASGPGGTAPQAYPAASLGGYAAATAWAGGVAGDLFNVAPAADVADARADYRAVYVWNGGTTNVIGARAYLSVLTDGAAGVAVGVDPRPVSSLVAFAPQSVETDGGYAAPAGVTFSAPTDYTGGAVLGDLPPGYGRAVWVKRVPGGTGALSDGFDLVCQAADARSGVRRVYWRTEPYAARTAPNVPPTFVPTPSPFRRMAVDYLTEGGARVTWDFDRQLTDADPYVFQLQASQSGTPGTDDWVDVGVPVRDALYLFDPDKRLYGTSSTLHYRVVLVTAEASYVSPAVAAEGLLDAQGWYLTQEVLRKELLIHRGLVRQNGYLLKARRYGTRCTCVDPQSREVTDSSHALCFGTGFVGGYHPAVAATFVNLDPAAGRERVAYNEGFGTARPVTTRGRFAATVPIVQRDAWVAYGSDERYHVHTVRVAADWRGVPVVNQVELRLAPRSDILYKVPVVRPDDPLPEYAQPVTMSL